MDEHSRSTIDRKAAILATFLLFMRRIPYIRLHAKVKGIYFTSTACNMSTFLALLSHLWYIICNT